MKQNKLTFGCLLGAVALITAGAVFANSDAHKFVTQLGADNKQTYQYIKTDFHLGTAPTINPNLDHGDSTFSLIEDTGIFSSPSGAGNNVGWDHDDTDGFKVVNEGVFGIEDTVKEDTTENRVYSFKITINIEGDRKIINLGSNTILTLTAYYYDEWYGTANKQFQIAPSYVSEGSQSSIQFAFSTYSSEFYYDDFGDYDIYKIVINGISAEYSCEK